MKANTNSSATEKYKNQLEVETLVESLKIVIKWVKWGMPIIEVFESKGKIE